MKINLNEVVFEAFSGSGPGGQNRNKVQCCIRATHLPTGLKAVATSERSQTKNKTAALKTLEQKIKDVENKKIKCIIKERHLAKPKAAFGTEMVRTYRLVGNVQGCTDHQTGLFSSLDVLIKGELDIFIHERLRQCAKLN